MATHTDSGATRTALRIAVYAALIGCGLVLFIAAGITGGFLTLNWLV